MVRDGLSFYQHRVVVLDVPQLKEEIFKMYHEVLMAGHREVVFEIFYWRNMRKEIQEFTRTCLICQQIKYSTEKKQGTLQPLPVPSKPWLDITMDYIMGLPNFKGHVVVLVVVDRFTKQAYFIALQQGYTTS